MRSLARTSALALIALCACAPSAPAPIAPVTSASAPPPAATPSATASASASASSSAAIDPPPGPVRRACAHQGYVAPAGAQPTLSAVAHGTKLDVTFANTGTAPICLYAWVATNGEHFDWITIDVGGGAAATRSLTFVDDRDKSGPVSVEIEPGAHYTKTIDLDAWARRRVNGARALTPGVYNVSVTYDSRRETWVFSGTLHATARIVIP